MMRQARHESPGQISAGHDEAGANRAGSSRLSVLRFRDGLRFFALVLVPTWAKGILLRRRRVLALAERFGLDRAAIRTLQRLRRQYGEAPLLWRAPARRYAILLSAADVARVLNGTPDPFTAASDEKRAALSHFEPHVALITRGPQRQVRRQFNDALLNSGRPIHDLAGRFLSIVRGEASRVIDLLAGGAELTWPVFTEAWFRVVREVVLGGRARDDRALTETLAQLRADANWLALHPIAKRRRERYYAALGEDVAHADPDSLAGAIAPWRMHGEVQVLDQVTHWLFAFDAGAITTFRALALFASHRDQLVRAQADLRSWRSERPDLPYLRAGFFEAVRLWPTTPLIVRQSTQPTAWGRSVLPSNSGLLIYVPFFHRDNERLPCADRFEPESWLGRDPGDALPFVPFSAGPAACPGRHVVSLIGAGWLAALLDAGRLTLLNPRPFGPRLPLPTTLNHFAVRLNFSVLSSVAR